MHPGLVSYRVCNCVLLFCWTHSIDTFLDRGKGASKMQLLAHAADRGDSIEWGQAQTAAPDDAGRFSHDSRVTTFTHLSGHNPPAQTSSLAYVHVCQQPACPPQVSQERCTTLLSPSSQHHAQSAQSSLHLIPALVAAVAAGMPEHQLLGCTRASTRLGWMVIIRPEVKRGTWEQRHAPAAAVAPAAGQQDGSSSISCQRLPYCTCCCLRLAGSHAVDIIRMHRWKCGDTLTMFQ
jgi:hypothetical protein